MADIVSSLDLIFIFFIMVSKYIEIYAVCDTIGQAV